MCRELKKIPVLFLIFDRKEVSQQAFEAILQYQPDLLYIAADGPRPDKNGEDRRCAETRQAVLDMIDWHCDVHTLFRDHNLGCAAGVSSAISWFFQNEEYGAIIEDDVVVSQDFFRFAEELLPRYKDDRRIWMITSQFLGKDEGRTTSDYGFSYAMRIWGWATWRRAWEKMDMSMSRWKNISLLSLIKRLGLFQGLMFQWYWSTAYKTINSGQTFNSWATRWWMNQFEAEGFTISPMANLSRNIGCTGTGGAHYEADDTDPYAHVKIGSLRFPLNHPAQVKMSKELDRSERDDFFRVRMIGLAKKLRRR